jgi:16S rRNA processing protein RimM
VLIPVNDTIVPSINRQQKVLNVHLPEGLLEVYTEQGNTLADDDDTETE